MRQKLIIFAFLGFSLFLLLGRMFEDRTISSEASLQPEIERFSRLVETIEEHYGGEIDYQDVIYGALNGMVNQLDPYTKFFEPKMYRAMRETQQGSFYGLGIVVSKRGGDLTVISPIDGTPAARVGLRAGDVIARINGEPTEGMALDEAVTKLKGPKGTSVEVTIRRPGFKKPFEFNITREKIPKESIRYAFLLGKDTGYIHIASFTATTSKELREAIKDLREHGMTNLLLDLRTNPGGLLDQAVKVADALLDRGEKIVYTQGRIPNSHQEHFAEQKSLINDMPLIVLVSERSASASEIVAGAVQDHDRGLILGERTWGKGLVQSVYSLSDGSGLALTTAKYFTPSGRLIQRDHVEDGAYHFAPQTSLLKYTDKGREVRQGGGIEPDVSIPGKENNGFITSLLINSAFFKFAIQYRSEHPDLERTFEVGEEEIAEFRELLAREDIAFTEQDFEENEQELKWLIKAELFSAKWGLEAGKKVEVMADPQVRQALRFFDQARDLAFTP